MATIIGTGLESYLHRQAREQALNYIAEAKEEANKIIARAERDSQSLAEVSNAKMHRAAIERSRRALAQAQLKANKTLIRRREELLGRLWERIEQELATYPALSDKTRYAMIERMVFEAAAALPGGPLVLQVNEQDRGLFTADVMVNLSQRLQEAFGTPSISLSTESAPILGGVIVRRSDRNQLVDFSLDQRLALAKRTLHDDVVRLLSSADRIKEQPSS
ncbi:MAG: V-type ATP synthase subunit E [Anaerolineae bacterium]